MWRNIRILALLLVLGAVALEQWLERAHTQSWRETLWVGIYPLNADGSRAAQSYVDGSSGRTSDNSTSAYFGGSSTRMQP